MKTDRIQLRIDKETKEMIQRAADREGRSISNYLLHLANKEQMKGDKKMAKVINKNGSELDFETAVEFMDDGIREALHQELAPCTDQEFLTAYEIEHEKQYGEEWELSDSNPVW